MTEEACPHTLTKTSAKDGRPMTRCILCGQVLGRTPAAPVNIKTLEDFQ